MLQEYKQHFAQILSKYFSDLDEHQILSMIELVPDNIQGDLGFPCFRFAKAMKKSPHQIATDMVADVVGSFSGNDRANLIAVGPYVNFVIPTRTLSAQLFEKITEEKASFGAGEDQNTSVLIEGRQPNTHKAFHIGHIRNAVIPEVLSRIMEFAGFEVHRCAYMGDVGAHVAKWIRYYTNFYQGEIPSQDVAKRSGELYVAATQKVDKDPETYKAQIHDVHKRLEDQDPELITLRKETRELCLQDMRKIFDELDCNIGKLYLESDVEQPGIAKVKEMEARGIAKYSEGAIIMDLEQYNLGVFVLLKSNGTSLYSTKDIALAYQKQEDFDFDISLYVVATEQIHHFNQLFKTLELEGYPDTNLKHVVYGMVDLIGEKMSSRKGNVVLYEELRDRLFDQAQELVAERNLSDDEKTKVARAVAFGALKFALLQPDTSKKILFDPQKSLSFEGETGPYLQYTYARCCSIMRNAPEVDGHNLDKTTYNTTLQTISEKEHHHLKNILLHISQFPETVQRAAQEYKPNYIAQYIFDLAQEFNTYYAHYKILTTKKDLTAFRLQLVMAVRQVLENGLRLLGIETVEKM